MSVQETDYAILSLAAYAASKLNEVPTDGWELDTELSVDTSITGFVAKVYRKGNEVVVSFRGTDGPSFPDWAFGNTGAAAGIMEPQVMQAINLVADVLDKYEAVANISFTGHSLGGGLASLMGVFFNKPTVVFDPAPFANTALDQVIGPDGPIPGALGLYYDAYAARQIFKGRVISPAFADYVDTFQDGTSAEKNALYAQRLAGISGEYLEGEVLAGLRTVLPTAINDAALTKIAIGPSDASSVDLHIMEPLLAMRSSAKLRDANKKLPNLLKLMVDTDLYATSRTDDRKTSFIDRLLRDYFSDGTPHPGSALDKFADDVLKLTNDTGFAQPYTPLHDGLMIAAIEYYNFKDLSQATQLFTVANEPVEKVCFAGTSAR